jgi:hypothetical protein
MKILSFRETTLLESGIKDYALITARPIGSRIFQGKLGIG